MESRPSSVRMPTALFAISVVVAIAAYVWIHVTGRPPAAVAFDPMGRPLASAPFTIYGRGLYLVDLTFARADDPAKLGCGSLDCPPPPVPVTWSIYRGDHLVARDDPGPPNAVDGMVRSYSGRFEREIGSVELPPGSGYRLEVRAKPGAGDLGFVDPAIALQLHPWDVERGMVWILVFWAAALGAIGFGAWTAATSLRRLPRRGAVR